MRYKANVIPGKGRGKRIGFPTLNLEIPKPFPHSHGIYAGWITVGGHTYAAAFHFGPIPTFHETGATLEAYALHASFAHTPASVTFELVRYLREIRVFKTSKALAKQIKKDVARTRSILKVPERTLIRAPRTHNKKAPAA